VAGTATLVAEIFFALITIFVVAFYWLTERTFVKRAVMGWLPASRANRVRRVWDDIEVKVGGWVRGQLILMATVGVVSAVGYFLIGIDYWPALALFIALAEAIPLVGPYIGTAPAIMVALTQPDGVFKAILVILFAIALQTVEANVLVPRVMKNSVGISPLTVIISILLGATLAGLAGALVAVPIAGSLQVIVQDIRAARESEEKFQEQTEEAADTRAQDGELVVAYPEKGETKTQVKSEAKA
jgi:predicted PurR-regulated permease PerM